MLSRRDVLMTSAALAAAGGVQAAGRKMTLAMHQNTSARAGFRASLEGWQRAGFKQVEITNGLLDGFLKTDTVEAAKRVIADLGLTVVSGACGVTGLLEPNPNRPQAVDEFKRRCDMWATLGLTHIYSTTATTIKPVADDYKAAAAHAREAAEIGAQRKLTVMFEFVRNSSFASTLNSLLSITRAAAQPNLGPVFDCYHFWSGLNKLEDLDGVKPGEIKHVHFQDVPDMPREMLDLTTRVAPGDGVTPLVAILRKLADKGYAGPLSMELLSAKYQEADPFETARELKAKGETVMRKAKVL